MDEYMQIQRFEDAPSASDFESLIESRNVPAVFKGCIKDWRALSKWNPYNGGLDHLQECVGSCIVEAMLTRSAPVFYGDLRSHERVPLPFSTFIQCCKQHLEERNRENVVSSKSNTYRMTCDEVKIGQDPRELYLAQVPILDLKNEERVQLEPLREDIQTVCISLSNPPGFAFKIQALVFILLNFIIVNDIWFDLKPSFLEKKTLASINLWMNCAQSRSSTHYDPHHNVLCVVSGTKQVILWPPSASPSLYPMLIYGEASNHSSVSLEKSDYSLYPRAKYSMEFSQMVVLHAGDALFIPEGWFHQVDSDDLTIAINFWWQSNLMLSMLEHMDAYYLRRILKRLVDREMDHALHLLSSSPGMAEMKSHKHDSPNIRETDHSVDCLNQAHEGQDFIEKEPGQKTFVHDLDSCDVQALHGLINLVHDQASVSDQTRPLQSSSAATIKDEEEKIKMADLHGLENDQVAKFIWNLEPHILQKVLLTMAKNFPRTLETLILHLVSPVGAEVLTRKFDQMDQSISEEDQKRFYKIFYSAFDDQFAVMDAILNRKESFAHQAFKNVLDKYLGVNLNGPNPGS